MSQPDNPQQPGPSPEQYAPAGQSQAGQSQTQQPAYQQPSYGQSPYGQPPYQQPSNQQQQYGQTAYSQAPTPPYPVKLERTDRQLWKWIVFGILTLGIYQIVVMTELANAANRIIQDGKRTMHYCLLFFVFSWLTLGIAVFVWYHRLSNRIGDELQRRGYARMISANDFWLFNVLPGIIFGTPVTYQTWASGDYYGWWDAFTILAIIGPLFYQYRLFRAMNALCWDQNARIQQSTATPAVW